MTTISSLFKKEEILFKNVDILGLFVDNHDMKRFLAMHNDVTMFKSALVFSLTARGITFVYQGGEHGYDGADDPKNREFMWKDISNK